MWASVTCKLGWEVAGVFPIGADGTDVNHVNANENRSMLVTGDDFGSINVYRFPVLKNSQQCRRYTGHSEHVPRVRFYEKDELENYIISAGGNDRSYIQWRQVDIEPETENQ